MLKRKIKKVTKAQARRLHGTQFLVCKECGVEEVEVAMDTIRVTCALCVQKQVPAPEIKKVVKSDKPKGWQLKSYFEHNGVVYSRGKEITDKDEIKKLKKSTPKVSPKKPAKKKRAKNNARTTK